MALQDMDRRKQRTIDVISISILCVVLFVTLYVLLGFQKYGLDTPYFYNGGDQNLAYANNKTVLEKGWIWFNDDIGAPYGSAYIDRVQWLLMNINFIILKVIGLFTHNDLMVTTNLQFLLVFPMCAVTAFTVLRYLKIKRGYALFGAFLFSCAPYIFWRNVGHDCLTSCYFIPFTILLCIWATDMDDADYLKLGRKFFKYKKNWIAVLLALLTANTGVGYYPVFSCILLLICGLRNLIVHRKFAAVKKSVVSIVLIAFFFLLAILPYLVFCIINGPSQGVIRGYGAETENAGLKIVQFFIPMNDHGIFLLRRFIDRYNTRMPLVNENVTAYLGIAGGIGFLLSIPGIFIISNAKNDDGNRLQLFSSLNIGAVMYATVGGFSSVIATFTGFIMMRSFNRMSIYILFISICTLCIYLQRANIFVRAKNNKVLKSFWYIGSILFVCVCIFDLLPTYGAGDARLAEAKDKYMIDERFVNSIEEQLEDGDMVYQLPYHVYPEGGPVNEMEDYSLYAGYLHSKTLKWSYGGIRGRASDEWNAMTDKLSKISIDVGILRSIQAGFKGIYIDTSAYTDDELAELTSSIEAMIGVSPTVSEDGKLLFYNLYPYIDANPDVFDKEVYPPYDLGEVIEFDKSSYDAHGYFVQGMSDTEDNFAWTDGDEAEFYATFKEDIHEDLVMQLDIKMIFEPPQRLIVSCGDNVLFDEEVSSTDEPVIIPIPLECISDNNLKLSFAFPGSFPPVSKGLNSETRDLAFALKGFSLREG